MAHPRLSNPRQLHEPHISGVRETRAISRVGRVEARVAKRFGEERNAAFGDAFDHRADQRLVERSKQCGEYGVRGALGADVADEFAGR
jgi:hypothetical protein